VRGEWGNQRESRWGGKGVAGRRLDESGVAGLVEDQMADSQMVGESALVGELFEAYGTLEIGHVKARLYMCRVLVFGIRTDDHPLARFAPVIVWIIVSVGVIVRR